MIPKLTTKWDFIVFNTPSLGGGVEVQLWEMTRDDGPLREKMWWIASGNKDLIHDHMNSLTDELCEGFFPKERLSKEAKKALKAKQTTE